MFNAVAAWVQANCPGEPVRQNVLEAAERAQTQHLDFYVVIGSCLTSSGPYLVQSYGGNLFVFALTEDQASGCGIAGNMTQFMADRERPSLAAEPALVLEHFEIDAADGCDLLKPIRGRCRYRSDALLPENLCLRIEMLLRYATPPLTTSRMALFCYPWLSPGEAAVEFEFAPPCRPDNRASTRRRRPWRFS